MGSLIEPKATPSSSAFPSSGQKPTVEAQAGKPVGLPYTNKSVGKSSSILSPSSQVSASKASVATIEADAANPSTRKFDKKLLQQQQSSQPSWGSSSCQWNPQATQSGQLCIFCGGVHLVDICPLFSQLSVDERRQFLMKNRLCFRCFSKDHMSSNCTEKIQCLICSGT